MFNLQFLVWVVQVLTAAAAEALEVRRTQEQHRKADTTSVWPHHLCDRGRHQAFLSLLILTTSLMLSVSEVTGFTEQVEGS